METIHQHAVEVDTKLADLWSAANKARATIAQSRLTLAHHVGIRPFYVTKHRRDITQTLAEVVALVEAAVASDDTPGWKKDEMQRSLDKLAAAKTALAEARAKAAPLEVEFDTNPWSRFFLVNNVGGHIHSSMSCSTCRVDTSFSWLPTLSGLTEAEAVAEHGAILCTVCFPSAPVEWTNKYEVEAAAKADARCPGSGQDAKAPWRKYQTCDTCGESVSVTDRGYGRLRAHKR